MEAQCRVGAGELVGWGFPTRPTKHAAGKWEVRDEAEAEAEAEAVVEAKALPLASKLAAAIMTTG